MTNEKVYNMSFAKVYPLLVAKAEKKGRLREEVDDVTCWLTGYSREALAELLESPVTYGDFFRNAPELNPNRKLITGSICGIRVESIEEPLMQDIRYLDKLVDELAKGKAMEKILRKPEEKPAMWVCPRCGKSFKRRNQSHYCGEAPKTFEEYFDGQPAEIRPYLEALRNAIRTALPEAQERISWSMPTFWKEHNLIQFAAHAKHIGLYAGVEAVIHFAEQLKPYKTSKGTIQIPYQDPLPLELIAQIAAWCQETGNHP